MDLSERNTGSTARHPWELARSQFFVRLLNRVGAVGNASEILDVGAGDAWLAERLLQTLPAGTRITCWDPHYSEHDLDHTRRNGILTLTTTRPNATFDGVLLLDVIEHVEDDSGFAKDILCNLLKPGGWALISVPAYQTLFTNHDRALKHYRRYSPLQLRSLLRDTGLVVEAEGGIFQSLLLVRGIQALAETVRRSLTFGDEWSSTNPKQHGVGSWSSRSMPTRVITSVLDTEGRLSLHLGTRTRHRLPGLTCWAFGRTVRPEL